MKNCACCQEPYNLLDAGGICYRCWDASHPIKEFETFDTLRAKIESLERELARERQGAHKNILLDSVGTIDR